MRNCTRPAERERGTDNRRTCMRPSRTLTGLRNQRRCAACIGAVTAIKGKCLRKREASSSTHVVTNIPTQQIIRGWLTEGI